MVRTTRRQFVGIVLGSAVLLFAQATVLGHGQPAAPLKVLFIGNSYTSVNDLPAMVAGLAEVAELTNPSKGSKAPRHEREQVDRDHPAVVSVEAKVIKLLDRIDNLQEMVDAPSDFRRRYCEESRLLADVIGDADPDLKAELLDCVQKLEAIRAVHCRFDRRRQDVTGIAGWLCDQPRHAVCRHAVACRRVVASITSKRPSCTTSRSALYRKRQPGEEPFFAGPRHGKSDETQAV